MTSIASPVPASLPSVAPSARWTGRVLSGLTVALLAMDAAGKILRAAPVLAGTVELGYPVSTVLPLGIVLLACVLLYALPRTAILGAILLTGYLGGAVATHVRVGHPLFSHTLFPVYVAVFAWGGLFLRDGRLRTLLPIRTDG